jgi:hypothetical protein
LLTDVFPAEKDDLDREPLIRGRLVVLTRVDYHASWVSNAVLSKLTDLPEVVSGGLIVRDKTGGPTGQSDLFLAGRDLVPLAVTTRNIR